MEINLNVRVSAAPDMLAALTTLSAALVGLSKSVIHTATLPDLGPGIGTPLEVHTSEQPALPADVLAMPADGTEPREGTEATAEQEDEVIAAESAPAPEQEPETAAATETTAPAKKPRKSRAKVKTAEPEAEPEIFADLPAPVENGNGHAEKPATRTIPLGEPVKAEQPVPEVIASITIEHVRKATQDAVFRDAANRDTIKAMLTKIGVEKASDLAPAHWAEYVQKVNAL